MKELSSAPHASAPPDIISPEAFFDEFCADVSQAGPGDRIAVTTMSFEPNESPVRAVADELSGAALRGADVWFGVDAFAFMVDGDTRTLGPLFMPGQWGRMPYKGRADTMYAMAASGVHTNILNRPKHYLQSPISGRSHIKTAVINGTSYIKGLNLHSTDRVDSVVKISDPVTSETLFDITSSIIEKGRVRDVLSEDQKINLADGNELLLDAGRPGNSLIYETGLAAIDKTNAGDWLVYASQYFPGDRASLKIAQAYYRGVNVRLIYNLPSINDPVTQLLEKREMKRQRKMLPPELLVDAAPEDMYCHAKVLATSHEVVVGNHNFSERGVKLGTAEAAYHSYDPDFAAKVGHFTLQQFRLHDNLSGLPDSILQTVGSASA